MIRARLQQIGVGWALSAWLLVTILLALNRGIDLLWGMGALLVAALVGAVLLPHWQLRGLRVRRLLPDTAVAGEAAQIAYEIEAPGFFPRYGVELHDALGDTAAPVLAAYFPKVSAGVHRLHWTPPVRGQRRFGELVLESRFPLGLARARRVLAEPPQVLTVYPGASALPPLPVEGGADPQSPQHSSNRRGGRDELFGLRPWRAGDEARAVHWRASARAAELVVREFEQLQDRRLWIVLDLSNTLHAGAGRHSSAEAMYLIAHSVALQAQRQGLPAGMLWRQNGTLHRIDPVGGHALRLRAALAQVELEDSPPLEYWLTRDAAGLPSGGAWLLFNLGGAERRSALLALAHRHQVQALLVEFDLPAYARGDTRAPPPVQTRLAGGARVCQVGPGSPLASLFGPAR